MSELGSTAILGVHVSTLRVLIKDEDRRRHPLAVGLLIYASLTGYS